MTHAAVVTAPISDELLARLDALAARLDQSRDWVIEQALTRYTDEELAFLDFVQEGIDDIEAGRVFTQEEVETMFGVCTPERDAA